MQHYRTFRLFISSTFNDLKDERNTLQYEVFPEIKSLCRSYGYNFEPIDLRWGVSNEAGLDHKAMDICLNEVEKIANYPRPNFLVMLGNRYGWIPVPNKIEEKYFKNLYGNVDVEEKKLLQKWYKKDENSIPANYVLQPMADILGPRNENIWFEKEEQKLRTILLKHQNIFPQNLYIGKSATEQEIIKGVLNSAQKVQSEDESVLCIVRNITNIEEVHDSSFLSDNPEKLELLKQKLKECKKPHVEYKELSAKILKKEELLKPDKDYLEDYAIEVKKFLKEKVQKEIKRLSKLSNDLETAVHKTFKDDRSKIFIGREDLLSLAKNYTQTKNNSPLIFYGESGVGKSAFMSKIISSLEKNIDYNTNLLYRFVGISEKSSQPKSLLDDLSRQIFFFSGKKSKRPSKDYSQSVSNFLEALHQFSFKRTKKLILIIDALDQFETKTELEWLEPSLPENIKIIVSTLPADYGDYFDILNTKIKPQNIYQVEKLQNSEAESIIESWLHENRRKLTPAQKEHILNLFKNNGLPLFLKIIFDQALEWHSYDKNYTKFQETSLIDAIRAYFENLAKKHHHAETLVEHTLGYISASKNGLSENELVEILSSDMTVLQDISNPFHTLTASSKSDKLPSAVWSRLYYDLLKYLSFIEFDGQSLISFYHRKIKECVKNYYYFPSKELYHINLLEYFWNQPIRFTKTKATNLRKLSELPYHCVKSSAYSKFLALHSLEFIHLKISNQQLDAMLLEHYEISKSIASSDVVAQYKTYFLDSLAKNILTYLIKYIKNPSSTVMGVEDIHATYVYKDDKSLYNHILSLACDKKTITQLDENIDKKILDQYIAAFSARKANTIRRDAKLQEAAKIYDDLESQGLVSFLDLSEKSRLYYDIGYIAYLSGDFEKATHFMAKSADIAKKADDPVSEYMSRCVGDRIKMLWQGEDTAFENTLLEALKVFEKYKFKNLGAKRWIRNVYAHLFEVAYTQKDSQKCEKYLALLKSDDWMVQNTDKRAYSNLSPYKARLSILKGQYKQAASEFEGYIFSSFDEKERQKRESMARDYYDYLFALKRTNKKEFKKQCDIALGLNDAPGNHLWKDKIQKLKGNP